MVSTYFSKYRIYNFWTTSTKVRYLLTGFPRNVQEILGHKNMILGTIYLFRVHINELIIIIFLIWMNNYLFTSVIEILMYSSNNYSSKVSIAIGVIGTNPEK